MYRSLVRPWLFQFPAEQTHTWAMGAARWLDHTPFWRQYLQDRFVYREPLLAQTLWGLNFANPLGLAAGFDKNGEAVRTWQALGFGFAEIGTVTPLPQEGNSPPRLFRLPQDRAILNRMGFNNAGASAIGALLSGVKSQLVGFPLGINLGKGKATSLTDAHEDYVQSFRILRNYGDYFTINVSSPNTPNLRHLQGIEALAKILVAVARENDPPKPILVKIAPDLDDRDICTIADLCLEQKIAGIIATNTTIRRDILQTQTLKETQKPVREELGGISGTPLRDRSTAVIRLLWNHTQGKLPIVGVGGITSAAEAWEKLQAGASLLQVYTGLVYEGPFLIKEILSGIVNYMQQKNYSSLQQAIGTGNR